jgi:hypothetical protein
MPKEKKSKEWAWAKWGERTKCGIQKKQMGKALLNSEEKCNWTKMAKWPTTSICAQWHKSQRGLRRGCSSIIPSRIKDKNRIKTVKLINKG